MATLTTRSTAINVWSHATQEEVKYARFQTNESDEFQVAYDSGDFPVRVVNLKFGVKSQTATQIVDALASSVSAEETRARRSMQLNITISVQTTRQ